MIEDPRAAWNELAEEFGFEALADYLYKTLAWSYAEPPRIYHGFVHVFEMLGSLERHGGGRPALRLAIWFHDAVYDPGRRDNEECSVIYFRALMQTLLKREVRLKVERLILATRHGRTRPQRHAEAKLLVDLDLEILASDEAAYAEYAAKIRKEYGHVDDVTYAEGRGDFLENMLERPRIFLTDAFESKEALARRNLEAELTELDRYLDGVEASEGNSPK